MPDPYLDDKAAAKLGLLGPKIMASARALHARELGKQMLTAGIMHEGGKVPKDGVYELEEGETVVPKMGVLAKALAGQKESSPVSGHFERLNDGTYLICFKCEDGEKKYSAKNMKEFKKIVEENMEPEEEKDEEAEKSELERDENGVPSYAMGGLVTEKGFVEPGEFVLPAGAVSGLKEGLFGGRRPMPGGLPVGRRQIAQI